MIEGVPNSAILLYSKTSTIYRDVASFLNETHVSIHDKVHNVIFPVKDNSVKKNIVTEERCP